MLFSIQRIRTFYRDLLFLIPKFIYYDTRLYRMKTPIRKWVMVLLALLPYTATLAQTDRTQAGGENFLSIQSTPPPESQSGAPLLDHSECLPQAERVRIQAEVRATIDALQAAGKLAAPQGAVPATLFKWPTRAKAGYSEPGYFTVQNFVDHDNLGASLRDYNCGRRTYDFGANNGHKGTDILLWPFPWRSMDEGVMEVLAAAKGVIVRKQTGAADRTCVNGGSNPWNGVILRHADGTQSWYIHFKRGAAFITNRLLETLCRSVSFWVYPAVRATQTGRTCILRCRTALAIW